MNERIEPGIRTIGPRKLVGKKLTMSLACNRTSELWRGFMPRRKEISNISGTELYSMQIYDNHYFKNFDPGKEFEKWAAIEVTEFESIPEDLESIVMPGGLYAVFFYKGSSRDTKIFQYIFTNWLPDSGYTLDNRPHFEILGENYKNGDPGSEEEIWIPVKPCL